MTVPWLENPKVHPEPPHNHHSAHDCDDQLPIFSRVGRGLKGDSLSARFETDADGATYLVVITTGGDGNVYEEKHRIDGGKLQCYYAFQDTTLPKTFTLTFVYDGVSQDTSWSFTTPAIPYSMDDFDWDDSGIPAVLSLQELAMILGIDPDNLADLADSDLLPIDLLPEGKNLKEYIDDAFDNVSDSILTLQSEIDGIEVGLPEIPLSIPHGGTGTDGSGLDGNLLLIYDPSDNRIEEISVEDAKSLLGIQDSQPLEQYEILPDMGTGGYIQFLKFGRLAMIVSPGVVIRNSLTPITIPVGGGIDIISGSRLPRSFYPVYHGGEEPNFSRAWGVCRFVLMEGNSGTYYPDLSLCIKPEGLRLENRGNSPITLPASPSGRYSLNGSITYIADQE